jgi:hypothetical protein
MSISTLTLPTNGQTTPHNGRNKARLLAVAAAVLAALAAWSVAELVFGIDLQAPAFDPSGKSSAITALDVAIVATLLSLAGWGVLALLERLTSRPRRLWLIVAPVALALSLGTPLSGRGVTLEDRVALMLLHLVVGAVLITGLARTVPANRRAENHRA